MLSARRISCFAHLERSVQDVSMKLFIASKAGSGPDAQAQDWDMHRCKVHELYAAFESSGSCTHFSDVDGRAFAEFLEFSANCQL